MSVNVLFFAPFAGNYAVHHQIDLALSVGATIKGAKTLTIGCDSFFHNCEAVVHSDKDKKKIDCINCALSGRSYLQNDLTPFATINDYITEQELIEVEQWSSLLNPTEWNKTFLRDYPIGLWILSTVLVTYQITKEDLGQSKILDFYRATARNCALSAIAVSKIIDQFKPNAAVVFNARIAQYRAAFEILKNKNIRVITHERGFADDSFLFYESAMITDFSEFFKIIQNWMSIPLRTEQLTKTKEYIFNRQFGKGLNLPSFFNYSPDETDIRRKLRVGRENLFAFFSSTEAEMSLNEELNLSGIQIPLLEKTINCFRDIKDTSLVIRHHPNIAGNDTMPPEYNNLTDIYRLQLNSPKNVITVMPTEELSSYGLIWNINGSIAPFSTIGVEAAARGTASLAFKNTPYYLGQNITFDSLESLDLSALINSLITKSKNLDYSLLINSYRFFYTYIERLSIKFKSIKIKDHYAKDLSPTFIEDIIENKDEHLSRIVNGIVGDNTIYALPDKFGNDDKEEKYFLEEEVKYILEKKISVYENSSYKEQDSKVTRVSIHPRMSFYPCSIQERHTEVCQLMIDSQFNAILDLKSIHNKLTDSDSEFICLNNFNVSHDSNFTSDGIDYLNQNSNCNALFRGFWIADSKGKIFSEYLTRRTKNFDINYLKTMQSSSINLITLLSTGFYKRRFIVDLVQKLIQINNEDICLEYMLKELFNSPEVAIRKIPTGIITV